MISSSTQKFEIKVTVKNEALVEFKNVRLEFKPWYGNVSFVSTEVKNVSVGQESTITAKLIATNTGQIHEASFWLSVLYETPQGESKSLDAQGFSLTVVPVPPPPFYATPLGIATIVTIALIVGVVVTAVIIRKK